MPIIGSSGALSLDIVKFDDPLGSGYYASTTSNITFNDIKIRNSAPSRAWVAVTYPNAFGLSNKVPGWVRIENIDSDPTFVFTSAPRGTSTTSDPFPYNLDGGFQLTPRLGINSSNVDGTASSVFLPESNFTEHAFICGDFNAIVNESLVGGSGNVVRKVAFVNSTLSTPRLNPPQDVKNGYAHRCPILTEQNSSATYTDLYVDFPPDPGDDLAAVRVFAVGFTNTNLVRPFFVRYTLIGFGSLPFDQRHPKNIFVDAQRNLGSTLASASLNLNNVKTNALRNSVNNNFYISWKTVDRGDYVKTVISKFTGPNNINPIWDTSAHVGQNNNFEPGRFVLDDEENCYYPFFDSTTNTGYFCKLDANGFPQWSKQVNNVNLTAATLDDSNVFVTGHRTNGDIWLGKYSKDGNLIFSRNWASTLGNYNVTAMVKNDANVLISGTLNNAGFILNLSDNGHIANTGTYSGGSFVYSYSNIADQDAVNLNFKRGDIPQSTGTLLSHYGNVFNINIDNPPLSTNINL